MRPAACPLPQRKHTGALEARKKGALESEKSVQKRLEKMGMRADEAMAYRLRGGKLWHSCWQLLQDDEKIEARATMRREALTSQKEASTPGSTERAKREEAMGLDTNTYSFGLGNLYYPIWDILTNTEKDEARAIIRASAHE